MYTVTCVVTADTMWPVCWLLTPGSSDQWRVWWLLTLCDLSVDCWHQVHPTNDVCGDCWHYVTWLLTPGSSDQWRLVTRLYPLHACLRPHPIPAHSDAGRQAAGHHQPTPQDQLSPHQRPQPHGHPRGRQNVKYNIVGVPLACNLHAISLVRKSVLRAAVVGYNLFCFVARVVCVTTQRIVRLWRSWCATRTRPATDQSRL